jgi:hypothetical protein
MNGSHFTIELFSGYHLGLNVLVPMASGAKPIQILQAIVTLAAA